MKIARSGKELLEICAAEQISLSEYAIRQEMELKNVSREDLFAQMKITLDAMKESATAGREKKVYSLSGLIGGDAYRLQQYCNTGNSLSGYDKHIPFDVLAKEGYPYIKSLILLGATKESIKKEFDKVIKAEKLNMNIYMAKTLRDAVTTAKRIAKEGDIVTLSPACASFDMFPNFMIRGNYFKEIVNKMK